MALAALALALSGGFAAAQQDLADQLTCAQAITAYEKYGVIYVMANSTFAVPVKSGVPIRQASGYACPDRGTSPRPYSVATKDKRQCVIALQC